MIRSLCLLLAVAAAMAPAVSAGSVRGLGEVLAGCCCRSGDDAPVLGAEIPECCCSPAPTAPPPGWSDATVPNDAPTHALLRAERWVVEILPRSEGARGIPSFTKSSRAPPLRELLGTWLL